MRPIAAIALAMALAAPAIAQLRESVTVEVIEVPVYVVGPDGQPVRGLTRDAFDLFVNGKRHSIEHFDVMDFSTTPLEEQATLRPQQERRLYLFLFDLAYSVPGNLARARRAAASVVSCSNPQTDFFSVATYSSIRGVQFVTPFLAYRDSIQQAIESLKVAGTHDPLGMSVSSAAPEPDASPPWAEGLRMAAASGTDSGFVPGDRNDDADREMAAAIRGGDAFQEMQREPAKHVQEDLFFNFGDLAARLASLEGQKHIVWLSEGFVPDYFDPRSTRILSEMFREFALSGVFLDSVDIQGLRHTYDPARGRFVEASNDALQVMAHGTGGQCFHNKNDLTKAITDLTRSQEFVYLLGFRRGEMKKGSIDVHVRGVARGTRVSFRQGFGAPAKANDVDPLQLADVLINDTHQTGVNLDLTVTSSATGAELLLTLPRNEIIPQLVEQSPYADALLYVFDEKGSTVVGKQKRITFDAALRESSEPIVIRANVDLPPGQYVVKALVHIGGTTSLGFVRTGFQVLPSP